MNLKQLTAERDKLASEAIAMHEAAEGASRGFTPEETQRFDQLGDDISVLDERIARAERVDSMTRSLDQLPAPIADRFDVNVRGSDHGAGASVLTGDDEGEFRELRMNLALKCWLGGGMDDVPENMRNMFRPLSHIPEEVLKDFPASVQAEARAMETITPTKGAEFVPEEMSRTITENSVAFAGIRRTRVQILRTAGGHPFNQPGSDDTANASQIVAESQQIPLDVEPDTSDITLNAYLYNSGVVKISVQLLQDSAFNMVQYLGRILGERDGRGTSKHFATGTGTGEPEGIVNATAVTMPEAGYTYDNFVEMEHAVDPDFRANGEWLMHDSVLKAAKKLKDSEGRPLWVPHMSQGAPATVLSYPYVVWNSLPATGAGSLVFGDMSRFIIRDVGTMQMFRFGELYMERMQQGFMAWSRHDSRIDDVGGNAIAVYSPAP